MKKITAFSLLALAAGSLHAAVVSGRVTDTLGHALSGVGVSDGNVIAYTDTDGRYSLSTDKDGCTVFVITPNGYEPAQWLVNRPKFWQLLTSPANVDERADFTLRAVDDSLTAFVALADIQMGGRIGDAEIFNRTSLPDINATVDSLRAAGRNPFAITLGDESWDMYWHQNRFGLPEVIACMENIKAPVYNVIGNHDHDPYVAGDERSADTWRRLAGPNYYSLNRGGVHFVMLDDVYYLNEGGKPGREGKRNYIDSITPTQLEWLERDLQTVPTTTPVIIAAHVPVLRKNGQPRVGGGNRLLELLRGRNNVRILSGHTHLSYAAQNGNVTENNYGAVCGTWWWTQHYGNPGLCVDGTPDGYAVWTVDNGIPTGRYKSVGMPMDYQFRVLDGNKLDSPEKNAVIVNVWGWEPGWKIEMTESGRPLKVVQTPRTDPMHTKWCQEPQVRAGKKKPNKAVETQHIFTAVTRKAATPVTVTVTDAQGRTYTQTLTRK